MPVSPMATTRGCSASRSMTTLASSVSALARVGCSATAAYTRGSASAASVTHRADAEVVGDGHDRLDTDRLGAVHDRLDAVRVGGPAGVEMSVRVDQRRQWLGGGRPLPVA